MIVKFVEHFHNGVQSHTLSRYAIGYIVRGEKHIYNGDKRQTISKGDVFFLGIGTHYTEEVPDESNTFEQILFYYQPADLHKILMYLNLTYGLNISYNHACPECQGANAVSTPAWQLLKGFFSNTANYLRGEGFLHDETAENIKMTELVYLIVSHDECCLRSKILGNSQALPFKLRFNPQAFPTGMRVELRGRASQSGQLILHLPAQPITQPNTQVLGQLQFVKAP